MTTRIPAVGLKMTLVQTKAPLLNNTRSNWMMEEFHLPRFRKVTAWVLPS